MGYGTATYKSCNLSLGKWVDGVNVKLDLGDDRVTQNVSKQASKMLHHLEIKHYLRPNGPSRMNFILNLPTSKMS